MPWASFSMLNGPGGTGPWHRKASAKTQVILTRFLQSEVKIIHIIVQNNTYYSARSRQTKQQHIYSVVDKEKAREGTVLKIQNHETVCKDNVNTDTFFYKIYM